MTEPVDALVARNEAVHDEIIGVWRCAMRHVTALELEAAASVWLVFERALAAHAALEDADVFPIFSGYDPPRGASAAILDGEHRKLEALTAEGRAVIEGLAGTSEPRRDAMIEQLGPLLRVRNLFDHHSERENSLVYPTLSKCATVAERDAVDKALVSSLAEVRGLAARVRGTGRSD